MHITFILVICHLIQVSDVRPCRLYEVNSHSDEVVLELVGAGSMLSMWCHRDSTFAKLHHLDVWRDSERSRCLEKNDVAETMRKISE